MLILFTSATALVAPTKLVVLQHGLYGAAVNMAVLQEELQRLGGADVLVHLAGANEGTRTRDGVAAGGRRLASEVDQLASRNPGLQTISLVGNSLGGLYARYAAAELLDEASGRIAGLQPDAFVTVGCPHLGVRQFTFLPLPPPLVRLGPLVAGRTATDLLLRDGGGEGAPLLVEMAREGGRGLTALRAFRRRRLYANLKGDFMVPFGTAAFELDAGGAGRWGAGVGDAWRMAAWAEACEFCDSAVLAGEASGICGVRDVAPRPPSASEEEAAGGGAADGWEEAMRAGLEGCGWSKVGCAWASAGTATPVAHNKLPALRRPDGWRRGFEAIEGAHEGRPIMAHAAAYILGSLERLEGAHGKLRTSAPVMAHAAEFLLDDYRN